VRQQLFGKNAVDSCLKKRQGKGMNAMNDQAIDFENLDLDELMKKFYLEINQQTETAVVREEKAYQPYQPPKIPPPPRPFAFQPDRISPAPPNPLVINPREQAIPVKFQAVSGEQAGQPDTDFTNNIEFDTRFKGYDRAQVDDYIDKITLDYNAICKKCAALEEENEGLRQALAGLGARGGAHERSGM
jgi:DivIVA domain-containing protein